MRKNAIKILIALTMFMLFVGGVNFTGNNNSSNKKLVEQRKKSETIKNKENASWEIELELLKKEGIDTTQIIILDEREIFSKEVLDEIQERDDKFAEAGLHKTSDIFYVNKEDIEDVGEENVGNTGFTTCTVIKHKFKITKKARNIRTYTTETKVLNKQKGLAAVLDIAWNLTIGSKTKYVWKACTILGVNPSNFMTTKYNGDLLTQTYQYKYEDYWYYGISNMDGKSYPGFITSHLTLTNSVSCYGFTKSKKAFQRHKSVTKHYYTKNYNNPTYIKQRVKEQVYFVQNNVIYDRFK